MDGSGSSDSRRPHPVDTECRQDDDHCSRAWDADDPRRQRDPFAPPAQACECWCLHCRRTFMSSEIWLQRVINARSGFDGFWRCPTPNCDGAGFTFDIFPTDPDHPANEGWYDDDGDVEGEEGFDWENDPDDPFDSADAEYDPAEPKYKALDEQLGPDEDDDLEGEEWKYGLEPGERPEPKWAEDSRRAWEEAQRRYDAPDERPRVVDWSDHEEPPGSQFSEDDIPF